MSLAVVANLLFCSLAAYPLARLRFAGRGLVLGLVVATILIPFQVVMIPLYLLMVQLGLRNTLLALVIPQAATAFGLYLLRQSFLGVPVELEEAARNRWLQPLGEWWNVMIPAARADLITLAMFVFIGTWSDFLWPLVILDDPSLYTLPLGFQQLASSFSLDWRIVAAGSVVSILPVLLLFVLLQRFILPSASGDAVGDDGGFRRRLGHPRRQGHGFLHHTHLLRSRDPLASCGRGSCPALLAAIDRPAPAIAWMVFCASPQTLQQTRSTTSTLTWRQRLPETTNKTTACNPAAGLMLRR